MPYIVIEDFRAGLDTRKLAPASPPGSLQKLTNGHVTRGGEIEKRKAWIPKYALPAGQTFGLAGADGQLYVFGSVAGPAVPSPVVYQRLQHPSGFAMTGMTDTEFFDGKVFAAPTYSNGSGLCFYNGTRVTDWDAGSGQTVAGRKATALITLKDKVYAAFSSVLGFSAVAAPTDWGSGAGSGEGFINMSNQSAGSETLTGLGRYQGKMAVFGRRNTQIWFLDPDPSQNSQQQVLPNIGTIAPKSIVAYGDADVFFLSDTGVRSLRARDSSNLANVNDVGTPIDEQVIAYLKTLTEPERFAAAGVLDPIDGRYILSIGGRSYVFSYYASSRISAWSRWDHPFTVGDYVSMDGQIWARAGDTIYLYGGDSGDVYDASKVEIELPYIDGRQAATFKRFTGIDLVCEGEWKIYANTDTRRPEAETLLAIVNRTTISGERIAWTGESPVVKLRLVNERTGPAKLSKVIVHYEPQEAS